MSRLVFLWLLTAGAGSVSAQSLSSAVGEATPAAVRAASWEQHERMRQQSPFAKIEWQQMGPTFCGGRIEAIAPHPHRPATMYVGVGSGGLWKTVNNGMTWQPVFDQQATIAIGDVAVAASRPETVWMGTGEVLLARSSLPGMGVYRSDDGGATWKNRGLQDSQHIGRILIHPTDHNTVYVAAIGHQNSPNQQRGVFRTTDGGDSWEQVLYANDGAAAIDLVLDPTDPRTLYASLWQREASAADVKSASGVYRTTDGGDTWSLLTGGLPSGDGVDRIGIHVAPSNSHVVYALADEGQRDGFYRSVDAGQTWHRMNDSLQARWDWCEIRVSPDNADEVYSIGQNSFVSRDGGRTFEKIAGTIVHLLPHGADVIHLDTHAMWINPRDADHVIFGTDGGLFVTHDRCQTWLHLNNMPVAECYAVTHDRRDPWNVYVGTQDNAALFGPHTHRPVAGQADAWQHVYLDRWGGGDSYFTYRDPTDDDVIYYEHQYGAMRRKNMKSGQTIDIQPKIDGELLRFAWMTPFFPSAHNGRTLYAAANRVFKSTDRGESWSAISPDLVGDDAVRNLRYRAVTTLSESPRRAGLIFAGTDNGELYVTADDGNKWKAIHGKLPRRSYTRVLASGHDQERVYATQSGAGLDDYTARVFRSDDSGQNWMDISGGLPAECVNVIVEDPQVKNLLYVGTDQGVYASLDGGGTWTSLCADLPAAAVADLMVHAESGLLVIATHGRSCYLTNARPIQQAAQGRLPPSKSK